MCVCARARACVFQLSTYKLEVIEVLGWTSVARVDSYRMLISLRVRVIGNEGSLKLAASTLYHQMSRSRSIKIVFCFLCTHTATTPNTNPQAENSFFLGKSWKFFTKHDCSCREYFKSLYLIVMVKLVDLVRASNTWPA